MKKATWIFTIIITVLHFQSCKENEITGEDKLNEKFLASPAVNTAWEAASCANDCFF